MIWSGRSLAPAVESKTPIAGTGWFQKAPAFRARPLKWRRPHRECGRVAAQPLWRGLGRLRCLQIRRISPAGKTLITMRTAPGALCTTRTLSPMTGSSPHSDGWVALSLAMASSSVSTSAQRRSRSPGRSARGSRSSSHGRFRIEQYLGPFPQGAVHPWSEGGGVGRSVSRSCPR